MESRSNRIKTKVPKTTRKKVKKTGTIVSDLRDNPERSHPNTGMSYKVTTQGDDIENQIFDLEGNLMTSLS